MVSLAVFHLVWAPLGLQPFQRFIASYRQHAAGREHRLTLLLNGFARAEDAHPYLQLCDDLATTAVFLQKPVWDIEAYLIAAKESDADYLCYLNSHSAIVQADWLSKMAAPFSSSAVGLVGACGNYESYYSNHIRHLRFSNHTLAVRRLYYNCRTFVTLERLRKHFAPFPSPHIRTNAFIAHRRTILGLRAPRLKTKLDCYYFESGKDGMTAQITRAGKHCLVVGGDGAAYPITAWRQSATFRSEEQRNLLVEDNQTRDYATANPIRKAWLQEISWGTREDHHT